MSVTLVVLCSVAIGAVALATSLLTRLALCGIDRLASTLGPRQRARLWLGVAMAPLAVGVASVAVSLLPVVGVGPDHCPMHGLHHPHLCANHPGPAPGALLLSLTSVLTLVLGAALVRFVSAVVTSERTSRLLAAGADRVGAALVFTSDKPEAFALGSLRPRLHISSALVALGADILEPVLAHERIHARKHDLLWRALCPILGAGHLPNVLSAIRQRLTDAQEMAADSEAAATLHDGRMKMAEALLAVGRGNRAPAMALAFAHGDIVARVRALVEPQRVHFPRVVAPVSMLVVGTLAVLVLARHDVHHALETLLGFLS